MMSGIGIAYVGPGALKIHLGTRDTLDVKSKPSGATTTITGGEEESSRVIVHSDEESTRTAGNRADRRPRYQIIFSFLFALIFPRRYYQYSCPGNRR